jgi:rSAM/selenodomain-associated transferase 1
MNGPGASPRRSESVRMPPRSNGRDGSRMRHLAIIVFAREPIPGRTKSRLIPAVGSEKAARLADAFIRDTLAKAHELRPAELVIAGAAPGGAHRSRYFRRLAREYGAWICDQGPGDLGQRMMRALRPFTNGGALLLGTDTPTLPAGMLAQSASLLKAAPVVLAPTLDGGYYLVGVRGPLPDIFRGVKWGQPCVMNDTLERLRECGHPYRLGPWWYDVDRPGDLALLRAHLKRRLEIPAARALHIGREIPCPATAVALRELGLY